MNQLKKLIEERSQNVAFMKKEYDKYIAACKSTKEANDIVIDQINICIKEQTDLIKEYYRLSCSPSQFYTIYRPKIQPICIELTAIFVEAGLKKEAAKLRRWWESAHLFFEQGSWTEHKTLKRMANLSPEQLLKCKIDELNYLSSLSKQE